MAIGWFHKTTGKWGRSSSPPQPYVLTCDCGGVLRGHRLEIPLKPSCPLCGKKRFVFPACLYPLPESLRREWAGEPAPPPLKPRVTPAKKAGATTPPPSVAEATPLQVSWLEQLRGWMPAWRSQLGPLRLIAVSVVMIVAITAWLTLVNMQRERARAQIQPALERGLAAFRERRFPEALSALNEACSALDTLHRHDATANAIRQWQREAEVANRLSVYALSELLGQVASSSTTDSALEQLRQKAAGQWFLFDAVVMVITGESHPPGRCLVDLPLWLGDVPVEVVFEAWPWSGLPPQEPVRLIFAAQIEDLKINRAPAPLATLSLRPENSVLWCYADSYRALWPWPWDAGQEASVREVLQQQRRLAGLGDWP